MAIVIVVGTVCFSLALLNADWAAANIWLLVLGALTVFVGSRMTIQIPRFKGYVSVSDTLIFLTLLLYGGEFAIMLAAIEAATSAWKFCNRKVTVLFNAATLAISTTAVVLVLKAFGFLNEEHLHGHDGNRQTFLIALSLIVLTQFIVNTSLATVYDSLKNSSATWETWKNKYIWTFLTYLIGAATAGIIVQAGELMGWGVTIAALPVIFFVFLSYKMYLKNVEISVQQAEQAEQYAKILETQSTALRESEERFRSAFDYAPIGIGLVSPFGKWLKVNLALTKILGYSLEEFLATDFQSMIHPDYLGDTLTKVHELLSGKNPNWQMEQRYIHKNGQTVWTSWSVSAASNTTSAQPNLIFQLQDITAKKSAEEKLQHEATHDALTGLPNRPVFMKKLGEALEKTKQLVGYKVTVLFIDLDRFKYVNDSLGHLIGDELLKEIGVRLKDGMRPSDMVARLGGDEFTILFEGKVDTDEVSRIAERIQQKFDMPFNLRGHEVYSSASIGILHASEKHLTSEDVMRDADTAMYQAKRAGKARHEVFDEKMHRVAKETLQLETDLRRAVERECIEVVYQPIYSLETDEIECFESLARWVHPELGEIKPSKFIALAEEIGLINRVCERVLRKACQEIGSLQKRQSDEKKYAVSVNLSCRQFSQKSLVKSIEDILNETHFSPHRLKLEITESVFFEHQDRAVVMLNQLREAGIEINIDDFGTGYSNLGYLMKLPVSALKIDRSFVSMIDSEGRHDDIVGAIITLARNLGLKVIAEGVETKSQYEALKRLKCEAAQGYHFAPPMTFGALKEFLNYVDYDVDLPPAGFDDVSTLLQIQ